MGGRHEFSHQPFAVIGFSAVIGFIGPGMNTLIGFNAVTLTLRPFCIKFLPRLVKIMRSVTKWSVYSQRAEKEERRRDKREREIEYED